MEKKKCNVVKIIFRVLGIICSIVLIPALTVWVPAGGAVIGISSNISRENLKGIVEEAKLSDYVMDLVETEVANGITSDEIQAKYLQDAVLGSITTEWVDSVILDVFDAAYDGVRPQISVATVTEKLQQAVDEVGKNGFSDLYAVWKDGAESKYFTESFTSSFFATVDETIESEVLAQYPEYGATSLEELETMYDTYYGAGEFSKLYDELLDEKVKDYEAEWDQRFAEEVDAGFAGMTSEIETEINDAVYEVIQTPELREAIDIIEQVNNGAGTLKWIVYGVMFGAILLLVGCFWFDISGFVVSAVPMFLGGVLCKVAVALGGRVYDFLNDFLVSEPDIAEFAPVINDAGKKLIDPLFGAISQMGNTALITGVVLVGLAILRGVIKKNKTAEE